MSATSHSFPVTPAACAVAGSQRKKWPSSSLIWCWEFLTFDERIGGIGE